MEEQERYMRENPTLNLHKVGTLASIKWSHLKKEQQLPYEKRVEEMNKIPDDELLQLRMAANNDACYIKKEYNQEEEEVQNENNNR
jgi:hypothetical protein